MTDYKPSRRPSEEQQEKFLELVSSGVVRQEAARQVGSTGSAFRSFIFRNEEFGERYLEALEQGGNPESPFARKFADAEKLHLLERLLDEYIERALDSEKGKSGSSNRALSNLLTLLHDTFKPFLEARTRHIHEGAVGVYALPQIDTDKWSLAQQEEFVSLRKRMNELLVLARPEGAKGFPELEAAPPDEVVEDAQFEEVA